MQCSKCQKLYDEAVRNELPPALAQQVNAHVRDCPACLAFWQENDTLRRVLQKTVEEIRVPTAAYFANLARLAVAEAAARPSAPALSPPGRVAAVIDLLRDRRAGRLLQAAALLAMGIVLGAVYARQMGLDRRPAPLTAALIAQVQPAAPRPAVQPTDIYPFPQMASASNPWNPQPSWLLEPWSQPTELVSRRLPAAETPNIFKNEPPLEDRQTLAQASVLEFDRESAAVDPEMLFKVADKWGTLFQNIPPSAELDRLRKLDRISRQIQAAAMLGSLQDLKLQLGRSGQADLIPVVHGIENVLMQLAEASAEPPNWDTTYQRTFQEAELAVIAKDYPKAMVLLQKVVVQAPNTYLASRAKFQMGNLAYEHFRRYDQALAYYNDCIDASKPHYLSPAILEQIHARIELLTTNRMDNYAPLALFHGAESAATAAAAVPLYAQLLRRYPRSTLVARAVENMTRAARQSINDETLVNQVLEALDVFQQQAEAPLTAQAELAISDINFYRTGNRSQARFDYSRILQDAKDPALEAVVRERLRQVER